MRSLIAYVNDTKIGILSEENALWRFKYDQQWIAATDSFDLSPTLKRSKVEYQDGSGQRSVQWYFENLLPEALLRAAISKEADIQADDTFALLEYLGAESAGSLILLPLNQGVPKRDGMQPLSEEDLCKRVRDLSHATLSGGAPKRIAVTGAQNKLPVVYRDGKFYEPLGDEPSTHILKPDHESNHYPVSVINEYLVMSLALKLKLRVPAVHRKYAPEPIYIVERFDRYSDHEKKAQRRHIIDACQLLNKSGDFKYKAANLDTLVEIVMHCRNRVSTRLQLYLWLVFNLLIANNENHLKSLSFIVNGEGIEIAPAYDLQSTGVYHTIALADSRANWPEVPLAIALSNATTFGKVTRESVLNAGAKLGLTRRICDRELDKLVQALPHALDELIAKIEEENKHYSPSVQADLAGELRLIRTIKYVVVPFMSSRMLRKP